MKLNRFVRGLMAIPTLLLLGACSTQAWYEGVRQSGEQACRREPPGAVDECLARINKQGYDDYSKARSAN